MYNKELIDDFIETIGELHGIADKTALASQIQQKYGLVKDRSVYCCKWFAVRFCRADSRSFGNTVLSLSVLQKYDDRPFIVCLVTPTANFLFLANTTFLKKISHSSQELRTDNIKGSFNGGDIMHHYDGVENCEENFEYLFTSHENYSFQENLVRLVEATNNIRPTGHRFEPDEKQENNIYKSVDRAVSFLNSREYHILNEDLQARVRSVEKEIAIASFIDNVNLRGRIIEYLITESGDLHSVLIKALRRGTPLPEIFTAYKLGDYERKFDEYYTATDIKTKVMFLSSNPKGYNIDKLLSFLAQDQSVYLVFIVTIDKNERISTRLCSLYNRQLLSATRIISHWAGRNSRGVTQYLGEALEDIVDSFDSTIDIDEAHRFLDDCLSI
ncbi:MAG: hypothetical protein IJZ75_06280 [Clostridia bacterium]|nr:hypothetical protein [Clostridia bacterium]